MTANPQNAFTQYCRSHAAWLIKYSSKSITMPIYFVWYYDVLDHNKSKLLMNNDGQIFCIQHLLEFVKNGLSSFQNLHTNNSINKFVDGLKKFQSFTFTHFDMEYIINELNNNGLTNDIYSWITDFIFLVTDYTNVNQSNHELIALMKKDIITNTIAHYNECILWPSLDSHEKKSIDHHKHEVNPKQLYLVIEKIIDQFDNSLAN